MLMRIYALLDKTMSDEEPNGKKSYSNYMLLDDERVVKSTYIKFMHDEPKSVLSLYSSEYDIWQLGTVDTETGLVQGVIKQVCNLSALKGE